MKFYGNVQKDEIKKRIVQMQGKNKAVMLQSLILSMLPDQPRSGKVEDDPGFWTDGEQILCPSEFESEVIANFFDDVFSEYGSAICTTGYYDPKEDEKDGMVDKYTGFYYVNFD